MAKREARRTGGEAARIEGARRAALPAFLQPELCTLVDSVPAGDEWLHEIKLDGYRILARIDGGKVRLLSRNGKDWTERFSPVARALAALPLERAMLDGEVVIVEPDGKTSFQALQNALSEGRVKGLSYFTFDLIHLDGYDLSAARLRDRKRLLQKLLGRAGSREGSVVRYSDHIEGSGAAFHRKACQHGLEGVVSKLADSPYRQVRSREWRKTKCLQEQEFVIGGYTDGTGTRTGFGALLLGVHADGELRYAGKVGTGFTETSLRELAAKLKKMKRQAPAFVEVAREARRGAHWVEPKLVAEVAFLGWTRDGRLRHPSFHGLREDKSARDVRRERPARIPGSEGRSEGRMAKRSKAKAPAAVSTGMAAKAKKTTAAKPSPPKKAATRTKGRSTARKPKASGKTDESAPARTALRTKPQAFRAAGVAISNPSKILFPDPGITKGELAAYYEAIAPRMLPHMAGRPLTIVRCPNGYEGQCFFQKNAAGMPDAVERVTIPDRKGGPDSQYALVRDAAGLLSLVQLGVLEFHVWGSHAETLELPDRIVFDLDPGPGVSWNAVVEGAHLVREKLAKLGLSSHALLSGGKGIHVVLFVAPEYDWDVVKNFAHAVVKTIATEDPKRYTDQLSKNQRGGKIFLDYLRNGRGATAIVPYSTRARAGAAIAVPIEWKELEGKLSPSAFHLRNIAERLRARRSDPWGRFPAERQSLKRALEGGAPGTRKRKER